MENKLLQKSTAGEAETKDEVSVFFGLMEEVGAMGKYQVLSFSMWCVVAYLAGGLMLMSPFLFYQSKSTSTGQWSSHPSSWLESSPSSLSAESITGQLPVFASA